MAAELRPQIADYAHLEPLPDPPRREPDMLREQRIFDFRNVLRYHLALRDDVLIAGGGYLRHQADDESGQLDPRCVVAFGVNPRGIVARNGYVISEVGKPPDFVLEVASYGAGERDCVVKREGYAGLGVGEYWRFDPSGGRHYGAALAGDTLVDGRYERLQMHQDSDGLIWGYSEVLGLELCWDAGDVRLRDHNTKLFLPAPGEERHRREAAEEWGLEEEQRRREAAEERVRLLEAELRRRDGV